jgi:metal-responsive CopG/Arc/MetJ family transcriptional regulator
MKRATITLPDDLEADLEAYLAAQDAAPSLTGLVEAALRRYLKEKRLEARQHQPAAGPLRITPARRGSGGADASVQHDRYLGGLVPLAPPAPKKT